MLVQQNEFEYEFEFYKRSSNFRKNEFNIPSYACFHFNLRALEVF